MKPDIIPSSVDRYNLWYIPHMPMHIPLVRPRERALPWRVGLLESIRDEGLRHPVLVYGHSPKGAFNMKRWGHAQEGRDPNMYIAFGTNRYWALEQLGRETFPAVLSWNVGSKPPFEGWIISPKEFKKMAPPGRVWVQEHAFGWTLETLPEEEFDGRPPRKTD
jgi:hypothetical protein